MGHVDSDGNNKKFKTVEQDNIDQEQEALLFSNELIAIPDQFKVAMTNTLQYHFGHSAFRPGQLTVLHSRLGDDETSRGGKDTCVFWATG